MNTNQTIDGVPRAQLADIADRIEHNYPNTAKELRALLDSPACKTCGDAGWVPEPFSIRENMLECPDCKSAAQPQGEPVAWMFKYLSHSDSPPYRTFEVTDFHQNPKAPGIAQHTPLYSEQPAPVAEVMPEQLNPAELDELEVIEALLSGQGLSNLAGTMAAARQFIDEVTRLTPSL